jgi:hypothetical protein
MVHGHSSRRGSCHGASPPAHLIVVGDAVSVQALHCCVVVPRRRAAALGRLRKVRRHSPKGCTALLSGRALLTGRAQCFPFPPLSLTHNAKREREPGARDPPRQHPPGFPLPILDLAGPGPDLCRTLGEQHVSGADIDDMRPGFLVYSYVVFLRIAPVIRFPPTNDDRRSPHTDGVFGRQPVSQSATKRRRRRTARS